MPECLTSAFLEDGYIEVPQGILLILSDKLKNPSVFSELAQDSKWMLRRVFLGGNFPTMKSVTVCFYMEKQICNVGFVLVRV